MNIFMPYPVPCAAVLPLERESAHKLVSWVIVSAAGFALLAVIRDL